MGKQKTLTGAAAGLTVAMLVVGGIGVERAALAQPQTAAPAQQQAVPDAPAPQAPQPNLKLNNTITPVAPAVPEPTPQAAAPTEQAPGTSLPTAPVPSTAAQDDGPAPDLLAAGEGSKATATFSVNVQFVEVPFTVKDSKGKLVPGLTYRDVRIYENGGRVYPKLFTVDPFPLSVALVIDQSVTFDTMEKINASLSALQGAFTPYDEVAVFTYNNGVTEQTTFTAAQSARLGVILERSKGPGRDPVMGLSGPLSQTTNVNNHQVDPNTTAVRGQQGMTLNVPKEYHTLNDAILAAARETAKAPRGRRRVVYVISDGKEYGSAAKEKDVIKYLQTNNIEVFATLVGDASVPGLGFLDRIHLPLTMRDDVLPRYAAMTGGQCDPEFRPRGIEASFARIADEVRSQYTVGYYTHASPLDERYRTIEVRVLRPSLDVIAKRGYYPAASDNRRPTPVTPSAAP